MRKYVHVCIALLFIGVAGCSQNAAESSANSEMNQSSEGHAWEVNSESHGITITDFADRQVTFDHVPQNIVALSNGEMDIIYALGGKVVGRPTSHGPIYIKEAEHVEQIGSAHEVDLEKITYLQADVVLGHHLLNLKDVPVIESIGAKMVLSSANSIAEIKQQIELFGQLLQKEDKAEELIRNIDETLASMDENSSEKKPRVLLIYGAPGTYMAALPNSLSGNMLEVVGGKNIAAGYPSLENFPQYAQLNTERIIESNPQFILLMSHGNPEQVKEGFIKEMEQNPAWNSLEAVQNKQVEVLPSDLFGSNPGTRVTEALHLLHDLLHTEK